MSEPSLIGLQIGLNWHDLHCAQCTAQAPCERREELQRAADLLDEATYGKRLPVETK